MGITISEWRNAPTETNGTTVFAVGDVHGCIDQLRELLEELACLARSTNEPTLVFLGDLINRGPSSLDALLEWSSERHDNVYDEVHRLFGNHEQLLMIIASRSNGYENAISKFMEIGGNDIIAELTSEPSNASRALSGENLKHKLDKRTLDCLQKLKSHTLIGNLVLVHAGIDPVKGVSRSLETDWTTFGERHWAWIKDPFLQHTGGFGRSIVIHGHTPPWSHIASTGCSDPHMMQHDRLNLDGGTTVTGVVMAAQIENGRYRLIKSTVK